MVLILVVVDNGLVLVHTLTMGGPCSSLNPCCSGQWSRTLDYMCKYEERLVLILVVVDNGLVPLDKSKTTIF